MNTSPLKRIIFCLSLFLLTAAGLAAEELIQAAILLDTSSSMDGLIEQAKTQLWKIVNELALAKRNGKSPILEVALYEYGNDRLSHAEGYILRVLSLTRDLDKVSEALFALKTNGGSEYCGQVIQRASRDLPWNKGGEVLKLIFIAGNEPFTQGSIDFRAACQEAITKGIIVNTIFCGPHAEGVNTSWLAGADLADGQYFSIDQNATVAYIKAPQDEEIVRLNAELNRTYIAYGKEGEAGRMRQEVQDANAASSGGASQVERSIAKSKTQYYNGTWDLVDAFNNKQVELDKIDKAALPPELKDKSTEEQKAIIAAKTKERAAIQKKIGDLEKERRTYVENERKKLGEKSTLDAAMVTSIRQQAAEKKYEFGK